MPKMLITPFELKYYKEHPPSLYEMQAEGLYRELQTHMSVEGEQPDTEMLAIWEEFKATMNPSWAAEEKAYWKGLGKEGKEGWGKAKIFYGSFLSW